MSISTPFIQRPIATSLLMAAILLAGIIAYPALPIAPLPQVDFPTIIVSANLPGASPETMASSVATPLERQFAQIAGVTQMTSSSAFGITTITLQFDLNRNIDGAAQDIQAAITAASGQLPRNLPSPPIFRKVNPADSPVLIIAVTSDSLPVTEVHDHADNILAQQISQISGVAQVLILGEQKPAVRVQVDPVKLASLGFGLEEVRTVLANATVDGPKGSLDGSAQSFTIYNNDQLQRAEEYNNVVIGFRDGSPIRVRDIGTAVDGPENTRIAGWANGRRGMQLAIFRQPGANVIEIVDRIKTTLPRLQAAIPPGIDITVMTDRTQTIRASVDDVQTTMAVTVFLVVFVIFLFLQDARATLIVSLTVPLSLIGACAAMYFLGYSIDNLSLMGLTIAVGFVVDDAIVMLENIFRHVESGMPPFKAAIKGAQEIGFTIVSISFSLIAVFIPLLFMGGLVGRLFREFAVVVTVTIMISAFVSLTLTPMMCSRFLRIETEVRQSAIRGVTEGFFRLLLRAYDRSLQFVLRHQALTLATLVLTIAGSGYLYVTIPKGFFPQQDTGLIVGMSEGAQDISIRGMIDRQLALAEIVAKDPDIATFAFAVGPTGGAQTTNNGRFWISLKSHKERTASADQVLNRLRPQLARVSGVTLFLQGSQDISVGGRLARTQYQYTLQSADLNELLEWGPRILGAFRELPELQDIATDQQTNSAAVTMVIDRDTAARFGIQPQLIDDTLYDAFGQRQIAQYFTQLNQYRVVLEVLPELQGDPEALEKIYVKSPATGQMVPLSTFVRLDTTKTNYLSVSHQAQFPAVTISFNLTSGTALGTAIDAIRKTEAAIGKPATLSGTFQGSAQAFQSSLATQPYLIAGAIIAVYLILGMLYESYIHPITILSTLPSAGVGALLMLIWFRYDLSVIALIGIVLLIGIVKKNAIMMIDFALDAERKEGRSPRDAIYQACLLRFRPIMMTTMAALLGAVPLMLSSGAGSELRQPLGYTIVGGLLLSQWLTLYTTPVVYLCMTRLIGGRRERALQPSTAQRLFGVTAVGKVA
jgi:HAE1 family hydrophobic/amphiphilic exporter-1/multidrug efflux pump